MEILEASYRLEDDRKRVSGMHRVSELHLAALHVKMQRLTDCLDA